MIRPLCDKIEDDGSPCTSWAIVGYDRCVRHWQPGIGPKRLHAPAYTGPYAQSYKLDRPVQDETAEQTPARPYQSIAEFRAEQGLPPWDPEDDVTQPDPAESTPEPETVETPGENERPRDNADRIPPVLIPNPPSRRGWRRFFRRAA